MSEVNMPWDNDDFDIDGNDDFDIDGNDDFMKGIDTDGDGVADTFDSLIDLNQDGVADIFSEVHGADTNGDGILDSFMELIDNKLDGVIDLQNDFMDQNGDGIIDAQHITGDMDGDGIIDTDTLFQYIDSNGDGIIDTVYQGSDLNFDGVIDIEQLISDLNGDGIPDMVTQTEYIDSDGNGIVDTISYAEDRNGDGYFEVSTIAQDLNMDGLFEIVINSQNGLSPDNMIPVYDPGTDAVSLNFNPDQADDSSIIGDPEESMESWHLQETNSSCAVASQEFVLEDLLDREFSEEELRDLAEQNGWYSDNGTPMADVGNILEYFGLNVEKHQGGTIEDIEKCLENGGNVIVGVDADEIWYRDNDTFGPGDDANHALEVIGIDYSNPDEPMVILNDSGTPNGCGSMVPLDQFMDAWEDSGFFMVEAYN